MRAQYKEIFPINNHIFLCVFSQDIFNPSSQMTVRRYHFSIYEGRDDEGELIQDCYYSSLDSPHNPQFQGWHDKDIAFDEGYKILETKSWL